MVVCRFRKSMDQKWARLFVTFKLFISVGCQAKKKTSKFNLSFDAWLDCITCFIGSSLFFFAKLQALLNLVYLIAEMVCLADTMVSWPIKSDKPLFVQPAAIWLDAFNQSCSEAVPVWMAVWTIGRYRWIESKTIMQFSRQLHLARTWKSLNSLLHLGSNCHLKAFVSSLLAKLEKCQIRFESLETQFGQCQSGH